MFAKANFFRQKANSILADFLIVAGGGGGGGQAGGGGGAGGFVYSTGTSLTGFFNVVVGLGGNGQDATGVGGSDGLNSSFGSFIAIGGGHGTAVNDAGRSGGSGSGGYPFGASGTTSQGNDGGDGSFNLTQGGGGGAGAVGENAVGGTGGAGGDGLTASISGGLVTYAGGGGAGGRGDLTLPAGAGGAGGGGNGTNSTSTGANGTDGLGGGGGGGGYNGGGGAGGNGGKGIVIISYTSPIPLATGGTITTSGGNQIHTFTSDGTFAFNVDLSPYSIGDNFDVVVPDWILNGVASMTVQNFNADGAQGKSIYTTANTAINGAGLFPIVCSGNQFVQATVSANDSGSGDPSYQGGHVGLCVGSFTGSGIEDTGYALDIRHVDGITIYRMDSGSPYHQVAGPIFLAPSNWQNFTLKLTKVGNLLTGYLDGTPVISGTDATYQSGYIEIGGDYDTAAYYKNISGGNLTTGGTFKVL